jgi:chromosome partitioning protein
LAQTPARSFRINEARQALTVLGLVAPGQVVSRTSYQDAFGLGLGVTEYEADGFASAEIKNLWNWIVSKLKKAG